VGPHGLFQTRLAFGIEPAHALVETLAEFADERDATERGVEANRVVLLGGQIRRFLEMLTLAPDSLASSVARAVGRAR